MKFWKPAVGDGTESSFIMQLRDQNTACDQKLFTLHLRTYIIDSLYGVYGFSCTPHKIITRTMTKHVKKSDGTEFDNW